MDDIISKLEERRKWLESLPDGVPCDHRGCLSHISHPCEGCGRVGGRRLTKRALDGACESCKLELTPQCPIRTGKGCDLFQPRK